MKTVFADTGYWIALLDPQDTLHAKAISIAFIQVQIFTSEMVLNQNVAIAKATDFVNLFT